MKVKPENSGLVLEPSCRSTLLLLGTDCKIIPVTISACNCSAIVVRIYHLFIVCKF